MALPSSEADSQQHNEQPASDRIKQTIAGLDALLGINEEQETQEDESKVRRLVVCLGFCFYIARRDHHCFVAMAGTRNAASCC